MITADKGLAGAYNHNVIKMAQELVSRRARTISCLSSASSDAQYFAKEGSRGGCGVPVYRAEPVACTARVSLRITSWICIAENELDEVYIIYTKMENSLSMNAEKNEQLLPLVKEDFPASMPRRICYQEDIRMEYIHGGDSGACSTELCDRIYLRCAGRVVLPASIMPE